MNKKTNLVLLVLVVVILLFMGQTQLSKQNPEEKISDNQIPQNYETLPVSLGEKFTLHENQSAIIESERYGIKITKFYNSPCPRGERCIWSGVGIDFEHTHNGEVEFGTDLVQAFGYQTTIIDTDHETYAKLKITKIE